MASKYQKRHYEDVAKLISTAEWVAVHCPTGIRHNPSPKWYAQEFSSAFAADNPSKCIYAGNHDGPCGTACRTGGCLVGGFDRERFLKACGLESA